MMPPRPVKKAEESDEQWCKRLIAYIRCQEDEIAQLRKVVSSFEDIEQSVHLLRTWCQ